MSSKQLFSTLKAPASNREVTPITIESNIVTLDAITLMQETEAGCLVITNQDQVVGIFTERDVVKAVAASINLMETEVAAVMTAPVITLLETDARDTETVLTLMQHHHLPYLPVVNSCGEVASLITETSLHQALELENVLISKRQLENKYCNLFEHSIEGIFHVNANGAYLSVNPTLAKIYGYDSPQEMIESIHDVTQLYVDCTRGAEFISLIEENGIVQDFESQVYCKDGSTLWILENVWAVRDEQENLLYYEGTSIDISDRKRSEVECQQVQQKLKSSTERFRHIYENAPTMMHLIDESGLICDINRKWLEETGYRREEVIGQSFEFLMTPDSMQKFHSLVAQFWRDCYAKDVSYQYICKDGRIIDVILNCIVTTTPEGDRVCLSVIQNVTEQRQTERALQQLNAELEARINQRTSELTTTVDQLQQEIVNRQWIEKLFLENEARFHQLAASVPGMIYQYVRYPNGSDALIYVSPACQDIYEVASEQVLKSMGFMWDWFPPEELQHIQELFDNSSETLEPFQVECQIVTPQGHAKWVQINSRPEKHPDETVIWVGIVIDITEGKQIREDLQQSEARFQKLAENVPGMIYQYVLYPDGSDALTYVSSTCQNIYEIPVEAALQDVGLLWEQFYPDDRQIARRAVTVSAATLEPWYAKYRILTPSGRLKWLQGNSHPTRRHDGTVVWDGIMVDITERQQAEDALRRSEERFRALFEQAGIGINLCDLSGRFLRVNQAFCNLVGYTEAELLQMSYWDLANPEDLEFFQEHNRQALTDHTYTYSSEKRYRHKHGQMIWTNVHVTKVCSPQGELAFSAAIVEDITERKRAEEALQQSEERLRLVLQKMPIMMDVFDEESNIIVWNQECERVTGYTADEIINNSKAMELLYPDSDYLQSMTNEWSKRGDYRDWEWNITCKDNTVRTIAWSNLSEEFPIPGWACWSFGVDVSERKRIEAEMLNALEQERKLNELKSQFISMVSHEFRTPLSTILSSTELLQKYGQQWTEEKRQLRLRRIVEAIDRMTQLLNDVLLVGKAEAGKLQCNPTSVDLVSFCHELLEEMQLSIKDQHVMKFIHEECYGSFYLDRQLLRHILINLVSNAIKYSPQGGEVYLRLRGEVDEVIFQVQDSGIGISTEDQKELFTIFKRGNNVGTIPGTGLGLALVKQCVDLQDGTIVVESELGKGTLITVKLPSRQMQ